ncbi:MAG: type II secretory pathway protein, partial [Desulfobacteraceae bacterium]
MYLDFYDFKVKPFQISTDSRFLWLGEKHKEALATLKYGILDNKGFLLLTGDVGTGKTTLIHALV